MIYKLCVLTMILFFGCDISQREKRIKDYYYKAILDDSINAYQWRHYEYLGDSIIERISTVRVDGRISEKIRYKFLRVRNGLDIIVNKESQPYLRFSDVDPCVVYQHPISVFKNCYIKRKDYNNIEDVIEFSHSEEGIDGISMIIHLDEEYALIDFVEVTGSPSFEKIVRIEKNTIPAGILFRMERN
jgi:hypothetical protein